MRLLPWSALLLCLFACAPKRALVRPVPTAPLPEEAARLRRPEDSAYAARVRLDLTQRREQLRACLSRAPGRETLQGRAFARGLYVSPDLAYFPQRSAAGPLRAFEQCVFETLRSWERPLPVQGYEGIWVLFRLERAEGPAAASSRASPLFELEGLQVALELTRTSPYERESPYGMDVYQQAVDSAPAREEEPVLTFGQGMTRPVPLSNPPIRYSQKALEHGVEGVMRVRCLINLEGRLEACRILRPLPFMELEVLQTLAQKRYTPVTYQGEPVAVDYTFTINVALPKS